MKTFVKACFIVCLAGISIMGCREVKGEETPSPSDSSSNNQSIIKVALLLDTSNSMDGLIEQAKSRLWNIVNTLTTLKYNGKEPVLEIALYEYGNDGLSAKNNYIRQVAALTKDLDLISEKLFTLRTNGGLEYCGAVIGDAVKQLNWGNTDGAMNLIYIAGNEPFNQGSVSYKETISEAKAKKIYVNTIFCGSKEEGIRTFWREGATIGGGKYFNIDSDKAVRFIETPFDSAIEACDIKLNSTYIQYGAEGAAKKANQIQQDVNAKSINKSNYIERSVSKSKAVYKNESWDLVDKVKEDREAISKINTNQLPAELREKSKEEIEIIVAHKSKERASLQKEIEKLSKQRADYIQAESKKTGDADDLGAAITQSIQALAKQHGFTE